MKWLLILFLALLLFIPAGAQNGKSRKAGEAYPFDEWLTKLMDKDSIKRFNEEFKALLRNFDESAGETNPFHPSDRWTINFFLYAGWHEPNPSQHNIINQCYISKNPGETLTGEEILAAFNITDSTVQQKLRLKPENLTDENAGFFSNWAATIPSRDYLIVRQVNYYPNGSMQSWLKEKTFIFKRAERLQ